MKGLTSFPASSYPSMADPQPLVCVFFKLPPSDQLFMRIHELAWHVILPQIEKLTYAFEALLLTNHSPTAKKTLIEARESLGNKMLPVRDAVLSSRSSSILYLQFIDEVSRGHNLNPFSKEVQNTSFERATENIDKAKQAVFDFRVELESIVGRITASFSGDNNQVALFITEGSQITSVMIPAIEECNMLLQEFSECFENVHEQSFDPETYERNPPSEAEFQLAREKWEMLRNSLQEISIDWNLLKSRIANPRINRALHKTAPPDVRDIAALTGIPGDPVDPGPGVPPQPPQPKKARIPFLWKLFQCVSSCISSRPFC